VRLEKVPEYVIVELKSPPETLVQPAGLPKNCITPSSCLGTATLEEEIGSWSFAHLPIVAANAITDYRSQGHTFDKIVVDMRGRKGNVAGGSAYVVLSRVKT
jgi:hypothetical protein